MDTTKFATIGQSKIYRRETHHTAPTVGALTYALEVNCNKFENK